MPLKWLIWHVNEPVALQRFRTSNLIGPLWVAALLFSGEIPLFVYCFPNRLQNNPVKSLENCKIAQQYMSGTAFPTSLRLLHLLPKVVWTYGRTLTSELNFLASIGFHQKFDTFDLEICFAPQRRALFRHRIAIE